MSVIKPRSRGKDLIRHITRLDRANRDTLLAYAKFLDEDTEYILNQLIESVLAKDKEFVAWRKEHDPSYVPRRTALRAATKRGGAAAREPVAHSTTPPAAPAASTTAM